jgi:aminoglycoside/choline kinase family phosphotransferase
MPSLLHVLAAVLERQHSGQHPSNKHRTSDLKAMQVITMQLTLQSSPILPWADIYQALNSAGVSVPATGQDKGVLSLN